ncbi:hypothetical protein LHJ74_14505 [Streptomyces sp. N2-109]|uniref:Uncharacterized protein n=1 Tax=Streptomyces gossypii TaxID=2883101 RepID=A0ABT2JTB1_9ACTN|nr:hypothetical protein [Streptomyces gossypii]MCT2591105.1 hypothetical protein [Streptomyces gossypii]
MRNPTPHHHTTDDDHNDHPERRVSYQPVTVYAIRCDQHDCGTTGHCYDPDAEQHYELHLDQPEMGGGTRRWLTSEGWLLGVRDLCPAHATAAAVAAVERLEIEMTHEPLFTDEPAGLRTDGSAA